MRPSYRTPNAGRELRSRTANADLGGLPPTLIQSAAGYHAASDAERLAERLRDHGVDVRLDVYPVPTESFQLYWSFLPEAADALRDLGAYLGRTAA